MIEIAAVVLAAGRSSRYRAGGGPEPTKLVAYLNGEPLVRAVARAALASHAAPVIVVTGHAAPQVEAALEGLDVVFAHNPDFASGLASSLRVGVAAVPATVAGVIVLLGDMPEVKPQTIDRVIAAFAAQPGASAAAPVTQGRRGNPALLGRALFSSVAKLAGDEGARGLLRGVEDVVEVPFEDQATAADIDTPEDLERARQVGH